MQKFCDLHELNILFDSDYSDDLQHLNDVDEGLDELLLDLQIRGRDKQPWELSIADSKSLEPRRVSEYFKHSQQTTFYPYKPFKPIAPYKIPGTAEEPLEPVQPQLPISQPSQTFRPDWQYTPSSPPEAIKLALQYRHTLEFTYTNVYNQQTNRRSVKPMRTFVAGTGNFLLLSWDLIRDHWRCFIISRITQMTLGAKFIVDKNKLKDQLLLRRIRKQMQENDT